MANRALCQRTWPRARASEEKLTKLIKEEPAVRKIIKRSASLADLMTDQDREDDMRVLREAKNANTRIFDVNAKVMVEFPDHKTRLAAMALSRAYDEGTPVQRQVIVAKTFRSAEETVSKLRQSPELIQALKSLTEAGVELEVDGQVIDIETGVQKSASTKALPSE
jgi:hypothetical protein